MIICLCDRLQYEMSDQNLNDNLACAKSVNTTSIICLCFFF